MKKSLLPALRKELEHSFGRKILSSRDCLQMVEDIYQKTGYSINANTLRRFFGLVKTSYSASPSTLTILSKYCGFNSVDEIENIIAADHKEDSVSKEEVMHYLTGVFKQLPINNTHPDSIHHIVQQTVQFLDRNPSLIDRFQREIAKLIPGQHYYFEQTVNMDQLNGYYGDGLRYYQRAKNTDDARAFSHSLQVFRYWLTENLAQMESNISAILQLPNQTGYTPHVMGRLLAARIFYANAKNESIDKILLEATRYHVATMSRREASFPGIPVFELSLTEALVLTGQFEEALEFIRRGKTGTHSGKENGVVNPFQVWETIINSKKNNSSKKLEIITKPQQAVHSPNYTNKRYQGLLSFLHAPKKQVDLLATLIDETGYIKFKSLVG